MPALPARHDIGRLRAPPIRSTHPHHVHENWIFSQSQIIQGPAHRNSVPWPNQIANPLCEILRAKLSAGERAIFSLLQSARHCEVLQIAKVVVSHRLTAPRQSRLHLCDCKTQPCNCSCCRRRAGRGHERLTGDVSQLPRGFSRPPQTAIEPGPRVCVRWERC